MKTPLCNDDGMTLFVVLGMLAILLATIGASMFFTGISTRATGNALGGTTAFHIADAGINHAVRELSNNDGTNDFATIYAATTGAQIVSNNSFNGGNYIVTQQGKAGSPNRIKIRSVGTGPNGSTARIEAWVESTPAA